ncbi:phosphatase PAP2 family protein [Nocardioides sp. AN3]
MTEGTGGDEPVVDDPGPAAGAWVEVLRELAVMDRAVYRAVADTPSPTLDRVFRRISTAADRSRLWFCIAAGLARLGGSRGRRAALDGVVAIGATSATVNLGIKPLARRRRPEREEHRASAGRYVRMPTSTSFPSGHAASAFAFAYAVGRDLPQLAVPIGLLAGAVAHSRVHTGVHYPGDVVIGSILGAGTATMVTAAADAVRAAAAARRTPGSS